MSTPASKRRMAYVASQFPKLTETFILREVMKMEERGFAVSLYSIRPQPTGKLHAMARPYLQKTHYAPWFGVPHIAAILSLTARRPAGVMRGLSFLIQDSVRHARDPMLIVKNLVAMPKMFLFTRDMERQQVGHIHGHFANIPTTVAAFASRVLGIRYSFTGHAWDIFLPRNQEGLADKIHDAVFVATCTGFNATLLKSLCYQGDRDKIMLNHHGLELSLYQPAAARDPQRIVAGGSLVEQKGLRYLIEAAAMVRDRGLDFVIEVVGDGPLREEMSAQIDGLELSNHVKLVGSMPHEELMEHMRTAAMVVLPSIETSDGFMDGIPNILIESLALAVPVVSSRLSGIPELVVDGETGLLVEQRDATALAGALESLLRDPARGTAMGRAGRARVETMFDLDRNTAALVERFEEILARKR